METTPQRSRVMSRIRGRDTKPELAMSAALNAAGFRHRRNVTDLPGRPDMANKTRKVAVFVDGSFWHGRDWVRARKKLKSNRGFWIAKIEGNMRRDARNARALRGMGYRVFRFWDLDVLRDAAGCAGKVASS